MLAFSLTPFKIDQNKKQIRSIDKVQNLGNERKYIYKDPRQDSGQRNILYTRCPKECFTQTYRDLYGDACWCSPGWAPTWRTETNGNIHLLTSYAIFSASFHTFCLIARAYLNTQKYGLFSSLDRMYFFTTRWTYDWGTYKRQVTVL